MYNMDISMGSYKVRVEILVALVVLFWIMFGHLLCGCCKISLFEGFREGNQTLKMQVFKIKLQTLSNDISTLNPANNAQTKIKDDLVIAINNAQK